MNFEIPSELVSYLETLDNFIESEIKPLEEENENIRFFDHRREDARTDWHRGGLPNEEWEALLAEARRRADGVLLTVRDEAGRLVVAEHVELRGVPYAAIPESDHRFSGAHIPGVETFAGFRGKLPFARLPDRDSLRIQAWAVDSQRMVVRPFAQHVLLSAGPGGRRAKLRNGPGPAVEGGGPGCGGASP